MSKFEFAIGDIVQHVLANKRHGRVPIPGIVVERLWQECPGGVQRHYNVRFDSQEIQQYNEIELVSFVPQPVWSGAKAPTAEESLSINLGRLVIAWQVCLERSELEAAALLKQVITRLSEDGAAVESSTTEAARGGHE